MVTSKRRVKIFMLTALIFLGILGVSGFTVNTTYAAAAPSTIGVVNYQFLVSQHPDMAAAQQAMDAAVAQAKSDFDAKSANMNDQDKQALYQQLQQSLQQKNQELIAPIEAKVMAAIKTVADAKGLTVVVNQGTIVYGGQDITNDVGKIITPK